MTPALSTDPRQNAILARLPESVFQLLAPMLRHHFLQHWEVVHEADTTPVQVVFPTTSVISMLVSGAGKEVEVAMVGREGFVPATILFNDVRTIAKGIVQHPGGAFVVPLASLTALDREASDEIRSQLGNHARVLLHTLAISVLCRGIHSIEQQIARWLLMLRDRIDQDSFEVTQEGLARCLGIRRPSVSTVASSFQARGFIHYDRGFMTLRDRPGLETAVCECYRRIRQEFDQGRQTMEGEVTPSSS